MFIDMAWQRTRIEIDAYQLPDFVHLFVEHRLGIRWGLCVENRLILIYLLLLTSFYYFHLFTTPTDTLRSLAYSRHFRDYYFLYTWIIYLFVSARITQCALFDDTLSSIWTLFDFKHNARCFVGLWTCRFHANTSFYTDFQIKCD